MFSLLLHALSHHIAIHIEKALHSCAPCPASVWVLSTSGLCADGVHLQTTVAIYMSCSLLFLACCVVCASVWPVSLCTLFDTRYLTICRILLLMATRQPALSVTSGSERVSNPTALHFQSMRTSCRVADFRHTGDNLVTVAQGCLSFVHQLQGQLTGLALYILQLVSCSGSCFVISS